MGVCFNFRGKGQHVRVRHLLSHTAGLDYEGNEAGGVGVGRKSQYDALNRRVQKSRIEPNPGSPSAILNLQSFCEQLQKIDLLAEPGCTYTYGYSLDVIGLVIEKLTGDTLDVAIHKNVLEPLGMQDTTFAVARGLASRLLKDGSYWPAGTHGCWMRPWESKVFSAGGCIGDGVGGLLTTLEYFSKCMSFLVRQDAENALGFTLQTRSLLRADLFQGLDMTPISGEREGDVFAHCALGPMHSHGEIGAFNVMGAAWTWNPL